MSKTRPMTAQSRNFILRNHGTMSVQEIADKLSRPYNQIYFWMWKRGMLDVRRVDYDRPPYSTILRMYCEGWCIEDICERTGKDRDFCTNVIHRVFRTWEVPTWAKTMIEEPDSYFIKEKETNE